MTNTVTLFKCTAIKRILAIATCAFVALTIIPSPVFAAPSAPFTAAITVGSNTNVTCKFKILTEPTAYTKGTVQIGYGSSAAIDDLTEGKLKIPDNVTYNGHQYNVTSIGPNAFLGCIKLSGDLKIPDSVTKIGANAFFTCLGLRDTLTIGKGVREIGANAFSGCNLVGNLTIPDSVTKIAIKPFITAWH